MPLTTEQLVARRSKVGSSDAAAILGVNEFRTERDVWMEKTGRVEPAVLDNEKIRIGNAAEPMLLAMLEEDLNLDNGQLVVGKTFIHKDRINASNPDGVILGEGVDAKTLSPDAIEMMSMCPTEIVEAKSTGLDGWGKDVDVVNDVPAMVLIQIHHQFYCTGAKVCYVPVLLGRFGLKFSVYRVERDDELAKAIGQKCAVWWGTYVQDDKEPDGTLNLEVAKRIIRLEGKKIQVSTQLVADWQKDRDVRLEAEKVEKAALANLLAVLGDAEIGECDIGNFTYREQSRKGYVVKPTTFRVPRFTKAK